MDAIKDFKNGMMGMLAEVYQTCKNFSLSSHNSFPDVAIELLWCTEPVQNQPYQAAIRMFLILRGIGQDEATVASLLDKVANLCTVTLRLQKYTYSDVDVEAFLPLLREVDTSSIIALVKDEKLINLQNMLMPSCLGFDRIPESTAGLSKLVNSLMGFPNVAVSIQLIPTVLAPETRASLEQNFQMLDTLSHGIMEQGIGNVSFASASNPLETYRFYHDNQDQALFDFNFVVYGSHLQGDSVASALYGQLNSGCNSKAQIKFIRLQTEEANLCGNFYPLPWAIHRAEQPEQHRRKRRARREQQQHRAGKARARRLFLPARLQNGAADRTGEADARADSLQQRRCRIGKRDGGEAEVTERLADEKPVHDRVQARERERKHGREHIGRKRVMPSCLHLIISVSFSKIILNSAIASIISCTRASPMRAKTASSSA